MGLSSEFLCKFECTCTCTQISDDDDDDDDDDILGYRCVCFTLFFAMILGISIYMAVVVAAFSS